MAEINASINLMNGMTQPLMAVINSVNNVISTLNAVNNTNVNIDTSSLRATQEVLNNTSADLLRLQREMENEINNNTLAQENFNNSLRRGANASDNLFGKIKRVVAAYAGIQSLKMGINLSDTMTQNTARLNLMNDGRQTTEELQNIIYQSAQNSRGNYLNTTDSIAKMGLMAPDAFNSNTELVGFMELINKQFKIAGTNAAGIDAAMLQLTQAMGSGALRGEELNSVLEQAPIIVRNIANYMGVPVGQIKDLASQGKITATVVKNAMFAAVNDINKQFESIPMTFTDIMTQFKNTVTQGFTPVAKQINDALNSERMKEFVNKSTLLVGKLINAISGSIEVIGAVGAVVYDNWSLIAPVIGTVVAGMTAYNIALKAIAVTTGISKAVTLGYNLALIAKSVLLGNANKALIATTAAQWKLNAGMLACPVTWIVAGIIAAIGALYLGVAAFNKFTGSAVSATGIIVGGIYAIGANIWNMIAASVNMFIGFAEFLANILHHPIIGIQRLFLNLGISIISIIKSTMSLVDKFVDTGISDKLSEIENGLRTKLEVTTADDYKDFKSVTGGKLDYMKFMDAGKRFELGYGIGDEIGSSLDVTKALGLDKTNDILNQIAGNTAKTNTSLDLTKEELKYMRDVAEQEVINRYTTSSLKVEMTNNNNINDKFSLEDIMSKITDGVVEASNILAEGNY